MAPFNLSITNHLLLILCLFCDSLRPQPSYCPSTSLHLTLNLKSHFLRNSISNLILTLTHFDINPPTTTPNPYIQKALFLFP